MVCSLQFAGIRSGDGNVADELMCLPSVVSLSPPTTASDLGTSLQYEHCTRDLLSLSCFYYCRPWNVSRSLCRFLQPLYRARALLLMRLIYCCSSCACSEDNHATSSSTLARGAGSGVRYAGQGRGRLRIRVPKWHEWIHISVYKSAY